MINRLLFGLTAGLPCRLITLPSGPYLERYWLGRWFGYTAYLHRFVSPDGERHLHNHPWHARSLVLAGGYVEEVVTDLTAEGPLTERHRVRWWSAVPANKFHRIAAVEPGTWTLFVHAPRIPGKGWGFLQGREFTPDTTSPGPDWHRTAPARGVIDENDLV